MATRKTLPTKASVRTFIDEIADQRRRRDCQAILAMMTKATGLKPVMWGESIVGFGEHDYSYPDTPHKSTRWFEAGFSPRKAAVAVYLMGRFDAAAAKQLGLRA